MKILVDMDLTPTWVPFLKSHGHEARHWSEVGRGSDPDSALIQWAQKEAYIVLTQDLDFGIMLAMSRATSPSVTQLRFGNLFPEDVGDRVLKGLKQIANELEDGHCLVTLDARRTRVSVLPLR